MKLVFLLVAFAMAVSVAKGYSDEDAWRDYKKKHKLNYNIAGDGGQRDNFRKKIFLAQKEKIQRHNSEKSSRFFKTLNEFSVLRPWEKNRFLGVDASMVPTAQFLKSIPVLTQSSVLPASMDYRYDPCLPPIKRQMNCGSCWAFAAITLLEFSKCKLSGSPVLLSEQQLVDCDNKDHGCNGGWYMTAWNYLQNSGNGSAKGNLYPYTARKSVYIFKPSMIGAKVASYNYIQSNNATAMQVALQTKGPIAVGITVVDSFFPYGGGVYDDPDCDGEDVNHAVVVVGYGTLNGKKYWIIRNTWGTGWGIAGYGRIERDVNKCGIETYPAYATAAA